MFFVYLFVFLHKEATKIQDPWSEARKSWIPSSFKVKSNNQMGQIPFSENLKDAHYVGSPNSTTAKNLTQEQMQFIETVMESNFS